MGAKPGFMLYHADLQDLFDLFTDAEIGALVRSLYHTSTQRTTESFSDRALQVKYQEMSRKIIRDDEEYSRKCEQNSFNRRQRPSTAVNDRKEPSLTVRVNGTVTKTVKGEGTINEPPALEAVRDYILSKGYAFDPSVFYAYYQARGWAGVVDWKAQADLWQQREHKQKNYEAERTNDSAYDEYEARIQSELFGSGGSA